MCVHTPTSTYAPPQATHTRQRLGLLTLAANSGKGGKIRVPYREGAGGDGIPHTSLPGAVFRPAGAGAEERGAKGRGAGAEGVAAKAPVTLDSIRSKVEAAQKNVLTDSSLENFISGTNMYIRVVYIYVYIYICICCECTSLEYIQEAAL